MLKNKLSDLQISELELLNESLESSAQKQILTQRVSTSKRTLNMTIVVIVSLVILLIVNFSLDTYQSYLSIAESSSVLAIVYLLVYLSAILGLLIYIFFTIRSYVNLKDAFTLQSQTLQVTTYAEEKEIALSILKHYMHHQNPDISTKASNLHEKLNSNSLHSPFTSIKTEIINELDKEAANSVYASAKEVSLFTAFAPGSALDSIAVLFSSLKLMKNVFYIYGYKTNLFTSLIIIRKILENASIAALIEYTDDSVNDLLGNTILTRLSTKIAQGIGNGVLMLRIGNMLIQGARPFASDGSIGSYKHMVKLFIQYIKDKVGKKG